MNAKKSELIKLPNNDVFKIIHSWPFYLLDAVKCSSTRSNADKVQFTINQIVKGKEISSYEISSSIDSLRELVAWISTYENAKITLDNMDIVKKELDNILVSLENIYQRVAMDEQGFVNGSDDIDDEGAES